MDLVPILTDTHPTSVPLVGERLRIQLRISLITARSEPWGSTLDRRAMSSLKQTLQAAHNFVSSDF
jgi:hypothetical protein